MYSHGRSEIIIGKALKKYNIPRNRVVILSKCYFGVDETSGNRPIQAVNSNDGDMVNRVGLSRKHIMDAVESSVQRLNTYIDVLQIHRLDRATPREEIMKALNDVVESGKVRYIGASSVCVINCSSAKYPYNPVVDLTFLARWLLGSSKPCKILRKNMVGISLFACKTTITLFIVKKSAK